MAGMLQDILTVPTVCSTRINPVRWREAVSRPSKVLAKYTLAKAG